MRQITLLIASGPSSTNKGEAQARCAQPLLPGRCRAGSGAGRRGWFLLSSSPSPCRYPRASAWPPVSGLGTRWALETSRRPRGAPWSPCWSQVLRVPDRDSPRPRRGTRGPPCSLGCFSVVSPPELFAVAFCVLLISCKDLVGYIFTTDR